MKYKCQYSGIVWTDTTHFESGYTLAIHPFMYASLDSILKHAEALQYKPAMRNADHESAHLIACALIKQLESLGYILYNETLSLEVARGKAGKYSIQQIFDFISTTCHYWPNIVEFAKRDEKPCFSIRTWVKDETIANGFASDENLSIYASLRNFVASTLGAYFNDINVYRHRTAVENSLNAKRFQIFKADENFKHLTNHTHEIKLQFAKSFVRKFCNLPRGAMHEISHPWKVGKSIELGEFWLSFFEISDIELSQVAASDIEEFKDHIIENAILGLPVVQYVLTYLANLESRRVAVNTPLALLASLSLNDATFELLSVEPLKMEDSAMPVKAGQASLTPKASLTTAIESVLSDNRTEPQASQPQTTTSQAKSGGLSLAEILARAKQNKGGN